MPTHLEQCNINLYNTPQFLELEHSICLHTTNRNLTLDKHAAEKKNIPLSLDTVLLEFHTEKEGRSPARSE